MQGAAARAEKQGRLEKKELQEKLESIESQMKVVKIFKALSVLLCVWGSTVSSNNPLKEKNITLFAV